MCSLQLSLRIVDTLVLRHDSGLLVRGNPALPQLREGEIMDRSRMVRVIMWVASAASALCLVLLVALTNVHSARAAGDVFKICKNQIYALCAAAHCFVLNDVAYCKCDVEFGDSISLAFSFDDQDVCTVNAEGRKNGYMVSTFSVPPSIIKPSGNMAMYTCPGETSDGAYA